LGFLHSDAGIRQRKRSATWRVGQRLQISAFEIASRASGPAASPLRLTPRRPASAAILSIAGLKAAKKHERRDGNGTAAERTARSLVAPERPMMSAISALRKRAGVDSDAMAPSHAPAKYTVNGHRGTVRRHRLRQVRRNQIGLGRSRSGDPLKRKLVTSIAGCCARAASGHATAAPPSATSNSRRPMVTVIRPSRAKVRQGRIPRDKRAVLTARHPAWAERLDFKRFTFGRAAGRVLINAALAECPLLGRTGHAGMAGMTQLTPTRRSAN